jgi:hypothetical protein
MVEEGRKIKYEITTSLLSQWEHHILGLWERVSPHLKIYVAGATGELVVANVASLTRWVNFAEKFSAALGSMSGVVVFPGPTPLRDPPVDFGAFPLNIVKMNFTLSWTGLWDGSPLLWRGSAAAIYWIYVSNILLKLSGFCVATVKVSILALMFSRSFSVAWIFLPNSSFILNWSLMIYLSWGSFLLKFCPLPPCWRLSNGKLGLFHPELKPWFRQKPLLEWPTKLASW